MKKSYKKLYTALLSAAATFALGGAALVHTPNLAQADESLCTEFTNNHQFALTSYNGTPFEYVNGATENLPNGYNGAVLKITTTDGIAYITLDLSAMRMRASQLESIVVRAYSPDYTSADEFRTLSAGGTLCYYGAGTYDMSTWQDISFSSDSISALTGSDGYLSTITFGLRDKGTVSTYFYVDSVTVTVKNTGEEPDDTAPTVSCNGLASGWNNVEKKPGYSSNVFKFSANFAASANTTNLAADANHSAATGITLNGVSLHELYQADNGTVLSYEHGYNYLFICLPYSYLSSTDGLPMLHIAEGTRFYDQILPECTFVLLNGTWVDAAAINTKPLEFHGLASDWNNRSVNGISNNVLFFGEFNVDFLGPVNGKDGHADSTNYANPSLEAPIAKALTVNGKPIGELYAMDNNVKVSYEHGYNYLFIGIPEYLLTASASACVTMEIQPNTLFLSSVLEGLTLYLYQGAWTTEKPDMVEDTDDVYTTVSDLFSQTEKSVADSEKVEANVTANGNALYKFLLKNDGSDNKLSFITHSPDGANGIKITFSGRPDGKSELVSLHVNGSAIVSGSYLWTENEWFSVRIAVTIGETLSVSVAIDGTYVLQQENLSTNGLGSGIALQNNKGKNTLSDYRSGDIKKPLLEWSGKSTYYYNVNDEQPADELFYRSLSIMDGMDGKLEKTAADVLWEDGAVTDGSLNVGEWTVTISLADASGNVATHTVTVVVTDANRVLVTFDGIPTEKVYHLGDLLAEPSIPAKEGFLFDGWYLGDKKWDFANDTLTGDTHLTANFLAQSNLFTIVITSEGLPQNYTYTFTLSENATLDNGLFARAGYTYTLYAGETEIESIQAHSNATYTIVYTEITVDDSNSDTSSSPSDSLDAPSQKKGCGSNITIGAITLPALLAAACFLTKKKEN